MKKFVYVKKEEWKVARDDLYDLIHTVQDEVRENFTFTYELIGSASRNMITRDENSNVGYDFDINIRVNDKKEKFSAEEIKSILQNGFNEHVLNYGYDYPEDSKRVLTIKVKDRENSRIVNSCDFAVVHDIDENTQQYIHFNKKDNSYVWEYQPKGYYQLPQKIKTLKNNHRWTEVRDEYLYRKNNNNDPNKKSRHLFVETINNLYSKYFN